MGEGQSRCYAGNDRQRSAQQSPAAGHGARAGGTVGQQLSVPMAPCCQPYGDPGADGSSHQQRKTSGLCSGKGQKVHRACGEPLTANN